MEVDEDDEEQEEDLEKETKTSVKAFQLISWGKKTVIHRKGSYPHITPACIQNGFQKLNIKYRILQYHVSYPHMSQSLEPGHAQAANGVVKFSHLDRKRSRNQLQAQAGAEESEEEDDDKDAECAQGVQD